MRRANQEQILINYKNKASQRIKNEITRQNQFDGLFNILLKCKETSYFSIE